MKYKKDHEEYKHYLAMIKNCKSKDCNYYTDNNIQICDSWLNKDGFWTFLKDLGTKPSEQHKLFRIDKKQGYNKDNCIWSITNPTPKQPTPYQRKKEPVIYNETEYRSFAEFCKVFGLSYNRSKARRRLGWSLDEIINEPNQTKHPTRRHKNPFFRFWG